jgi:hypothetical protein
VITRKYAIGPPVTIHKPDPRDGVHAFVARSDAEFRAYLDAEIASARVPWARAPDRFDTGDDDEELVEPVAVPAPPRRQRKRSLTKVCEAARKAGADRVIVDSVVIVLSPAAAMPESDVNEWDAVLSEVDHGPH